MPAEGNIIIRRAKVNNLKDITVEIPRNRLVVVTGISGSGKSSLAFDTLFAEGQRRFAESLSSYARQFLGRMSKPDVEMIEGIPPAIAIEQKVNIRNPRSTVATTTEIYDFLRLLFARIGRTYSPVSGLEVKAHTVQDVLRDIFDGEAHTVYILSDIRWKDRKDKVELMLQLKEEGYGRFFDLGTREVLRIEDVMQMDGHYPEDLHLLVDRAKIPGHPSTSSGTVGHDGGSTGSPTVMDDLRTRLLDSVQTAFDKGEGDMSIVLDGKRKKGYAMLLGALDRGETPLGLAGFLEGRLKLVLTAREHLDRGLDPRAAARQLPGSPYAAQIAVRNAQKRTQGDLRRAVAAFAGVDGSIKQGLYRDRDALLLAVLNTFEKKEEVKK